MRYCVRFCWPRSTIRTRKSMILESLYIYSRIARSRSSVPVRLFRGSGDFACCAVVSRNSIAVASRSLSFAELEQSSEYLRNRTLFFLTMSDARLGLRARVDSAGTMPDRRPLPRRVWHSSAVADNARPRPIRSSAGRRAVFLSIRWCTRIITQRLQY